MPERFNPDKFKGLTPPQLNVTLGIYFKYRPVNDTDSLISDLSGVDISREGLSIPQSVARMSANFDTALENLVNRLLSDQERRRNSELLKNNQWELKGLLSLSYLTSPAVQEAVDRYSVEFIDGFNKGLQSTFPQLSEFMGVNNTGYSGVFDPDSAKVIERELYLDRLKEFERWEFRRLGRVDISADEYKYDIRTHRRIRKWRSVYKARYNEKLPPYEPFW